MKITTKNYFTEIKKIDIKSLPDEMQQAHSVFNDATESGKDWEIYNEDKDIKEMIGIYLEKLNALLSKKATLRHSSTSPNSNRSGVKVKKPVATKAKVKKPVRQTKRKTQTKTEYKPKTKVNMSTRTKNVASVNKEIALIKRFVNMLGQEKSKKQVLSLMNVVQKYLFERRARRVYKYSEELLAINNSLMAAFQNQSAKVKISISPIKEKQLREIAGLEKERVSVQFIKDYINVQGKTVTKAKVKRLYNRIADAVNNGSLTKRDRYWKHIDRILDSLKNYYQNDILTIHKAELSGLQGIVNGGIQKKK
jgi:hypothetical protein